RFGAAAGGSQRGDDEGDHDDYCDGNDECNHGITSLCDLERVWLISDHQRDNDGGGVTKVPGDGLDRGHVAVAPNVVTDPRNGDRWPFVDDVVVDKHAQRHDRLLSYSNTRSTTRWPTVRARSITAT